MGWVLQWVTFVFLSKGFFWVLLEGVVSVCYGYLFFLRRGSLFLSLFCVRAVCVDSAMGPSVFLPIGKFSGRVFPCVCVIVFWPCVRWWCLACSVVLTLGTELAQHPFGGHPCDGLCWQTLLSVLQVPDSRMMEVHIFSPSQLVLHVFYGLLGEGITWLEFRHPGLLLSPTLSPCSGYLLCIGCETCAPNSTLCHQGVTGVGMLCNL